MIKVETFNGVSWPVLNAHKSFNFPAGELQVTVQIDRGEYANIVFEYEDNEEIVELLLIGNAIRNAGGTINVLEIPYLPYARQDRVASPGEALSIQMFADLVNSLNAKIVRVYDPHSDVAAALINNLVAVTQSDIFVPLITSNISEPFHLIACDAGSVKKINKLAANLGTNLISVVECSKNRNVLTGEITGTTVHAGNFNGLTCVMVDDICDGGRTFVEVAKQLKANGAGKVILMVTHGLFTKGLGVFNGLVDEIYTRKGKVYP